MLLLRLIVIAVLLGLGYFLINKLSGKKSSSGKDNNSSGEGNQAPSN